MISKSSKIALGTVQFGLDYGISNSIGKTSPEEASKILDIAYHNGITLLDTAQEYGNSESVLGSSHGNRFRIITKIKPTDDKCSAEQLVQQSLQRLRLDRLHGVLFHNASSAIKYPTIVSELKGLQDLGVVEKVGFSVYTPQELKELIKLFGRPDIIQIPYNLLDQRFEDIAQVLHDQGVEVHARSTFLQGLFFKPTQKLPEFFRPIIPFLEDLNKIYLDEGKLAQTLLSYSLSKDFIDYVVIGVNSEFQLNENLKTFEVNLDDLPKQPNKIPENILLPYLWPK